MYRIEKEIDHYEFKAKDILRNLSDCDRKDIDRIALETRLSRDEVSNILSYLTKSQYIIIDRDNTISITDYGKMINNGEINVGYAPI